MVHGIDNLRVTRHRDIGAVGIHHNAHAMDVIVPYEYDV